MSESNGPALPPLPPFEDRRRTVETLRRTAQLLQDLGVTEVAQVEQYNESVGFSEHKSGKGKKDPTNRACITPKRMNEFTNGESVFRPREIILPKLWSFYDNRYPSTLRTAWTQTVGYDVAIQDPIASTIHNFLSPDQGELSEAPFRLDRVEEFAGHYTLYRPFYANPDHEIMIMGLTCGVDNEPTKFQIDMRFPLLSDDPNKMKVETATGSIIPYKDRALLFGKIESRDAPVILSLNENSMEEGRVATLDGVMMVCSSGHRPSAYPVFGVRADELITPTVIERSELAQMRRLWSFLEKPMSRGIVDWRG